MFRWIPYTFVRTVIFFIGGILLGIYAPDLIGPRVSILLIVLLSLLYLLQVLANQRIRRFLNPGLIALPLIFILGYTHLVRQTESRNPDHLLHTPDPIKYYKAVLTKFAEEKDRSWKMEAEVLAVHTNEWKANRGRIVLYFSKIDFLRPFDYGDVLVIRGAPEIIQSPANPGEFDYKQFLASKNIYHQHFLRIKDVLRLTNSPPSKFMAFAIRGRLWAEAALKRFVEGEREQAIAVALVLGVTDGLDNELLNAYSATGSMHVLAVSGLHVSIIYFILLWFLRPVQKLAGGRWMVAIISLTILWMYGFVTGLTPSVLRAVTMFSFMAIATPWSRRTNIYNTLAVSAFCLLLFNPFMIRSVGFQLSYLAVLGIVYLYPKLLTLWEPKRRVWTEIWKITCVSISAQIATFSLGLLYFHQFPNYFLLSNLLVVPISFAILILGLLVLALSFIPVLAGVAGFFLELTIQIANYIVFTIESFPFNLIDNVYVSAVQCCLLMVLILFIILVTEYRQFKYIVWASVIAVSFATIQWLHFSSDVNIKQLTVYKIPGHSAIDFIDRGQTVFLTDSALIKDHEKIRFHVRGNRLMAGVRKVSHALPHSQTLKGSNLIAWHGMTILHITEKNFQPPDTLTVDWIIIGNNAVNEMDKIARNITFKRVILDSSNSVFFATRFLEAAKLYKFDVHSVLHHGALAFKIENLES